MIEKLKNIWGSKKGRWTIVIIVIAIIAIAVYGFTRNRNPLASYELGLVERGNIAEEVSVTGKVVPVREAELSLSKSGKIVVVNTKVGNRVSQGSVLVSIENGDVRASLSQAKADLETRKIEYDQLVRASEAKYDTSGKNTSSDETAIINAEANLRQSLEDGLSKVDSAISTYVDQFFDNPRKSPQFGIQISEGNTTYAISGYPSQKIRINNEKDDVNNLLKDWRTSLKSEGIDLIKSEAVAKNTIDSVEVLLQDLSLVLISSSNQSSAEASLYSGYKTDVSTARTTVLTVKSNIESASQSSASAESAVTPDELRLKALALSKAESSIQSIQSNLNETMIIAPFSGTVTSLDAKIGELATPSSPLVRLISGGSFEIEAFVPESDISKVALGKSAKVTLDAYGQSEDFPAKVTLIDPGETIIEGVATYKVTFFFDKSDERIKSGMTANIDIQTGTRENVLRIPQRAVTQKDNEKSVKIVRENNSVEEVPVVLGLRGTDGYVEVISGLNEGDKIVFFDRKK
ncbi:MAG: efflux RND transporter periplasmic adaptor subunit [Candidatus Taylorbacteria bacterium]